LRQDAPLKLEVAGQREPLSRGDTRQLSRKIKTGQNQDSRNRLKPTLEPMEWAHLDHLVRVEKSVLLHSALSYAAWGRYLLEESFFI
jgi:hypothetical protein